MLHLVPHADCTSNLNKPLLPAQSYHMGLPSSLWWMVLVMTNNNQKEQENYISDFHYACIAQRWSKKSGYQETRKVNAISVYTTMIITLKTPSKERVLTLWLHKHTYHTGMAIYFNPNIKTNATLLSYTSGGAARTRTEGSRCHNLISHITALAGEGREPGLRKARVKLHMFTSTNWKVITELELFSGSSRPAPRNLNKTQRPSKGEHYSDLEGLYNDHTAGSDSVGKPKTK